MAQTRYKRPYSVRLFFAIYTPLCVAYIVLGVKLGVGHPASITVVALLFVLGFAASIFDPDFAYETHTTLDDGTVVRVRRPYIGFKHLETKVGVTGDYEVRFDGWRYEEALLRL